jgi:hypothetical protein
MPPVAKMTFRGFFGAGAVTGVDFSVSVGAGPASSSTLEDSVGEAEPTETVVLVFYEPEFEEGASLSRTLVLCSADDGFSLLDWDEGTDFGPSSSAFRYLLTRARVRSNI